MFKTRLLSGIVLVIAALVLIITGGDVLLVSTLLISWIGMFELYRIFHIEKSAPGIVGHATAAVYYANLRFGFLPDLMCSLTRSIRRSSCSPHFSACSMWQ